ncbi:D-alanine--D-alanine ligase family protein [Membranihabitans maritimus]|uniref:D-alanine--D-alanine ligase family protein n=1 Tax=Membranihabitans maritimus TaxID=2904244 RepID=UPI001F01B686|nr:D-alanine--D-alanine ligase [Membranihabitans maritimus]
MKSPQNIAVIAGGNSAEREVSLNSAKLVLEHLDKERYNVRLLEMNGNRFYHAESGNYIDLNDFSLRVEDKKEFFDFAFIIIHGTPAEDGKLQGYFDWMGIPYSTADVLCSSLTFNKNYCKIFLENFDIPMARSIVVQKGNFPSDRQLNELDNTLFIKPNNNGSSVAVTKVTRRDDIKAALDKVFEIDSEAIVESYLEGVEFSASILKLGKEYIRFPITEIRPTNEFFDYEAKYLGASEEITPARISEREEKDCLDLSEKIYRILGCEGICRFDFIQSNGVFYFLEVNTIPGMSEVSMVPQQAIAKGWSISELLDKIIESKRG